MYDACSHIIHIHRFDLRPFLYNVGWTRQFSTIDHLVKFQQESLSNTRTHPSTNSSSSSTASDNNNQQEGSSDNEEEEEVVGTSAKIDADADSI